MKYLRCLTFKVPSNILYVKEEVGGRSTGFKRGEREIWAFSLLPSAASTKQQYTWVCRSNREGSNQHSWCMSAWQCKCGGWITKVHLTPNSPKPPAGLSSGTRLAYLSWEQTLLQLINQPLFFPLVYGFILGLCSFLSAFIILSLEHLYLICLCFLFWFAVVWLLYIFNCAPLGCYVITAFKINYGPSMKLFWQAVS